MVFREFLSSAITADSSPKYAPGKTHMWYIVYGDDHKIYSTAAGFRVAKTFSSFPSKYCTYCCADTGLKTLPQELLYVYVAAIRISASEHTCCLLRSVNWIGMTPDWYCVKSNVSTCTNSARALSLLCANLTIDLEYRHVDHNLKEPMIATDPMLPWACTARYVQSVGFTLCESNPTS